MRAWILESKLYNKLRMLGGLPSGCRAGDPVVEWTQIHKSACVWGTLKRKPEHAAFQHARDMASQISSLLCVTLPEKLYTLMLAQCGSLGTVFAIGFPYVSCWYGTLLSLIPGRLLLRKKMKCPFNPELGNRVREQTYHVSLSNVPHPSASASTVLISTLWK